MKQNQTALSHICPVLYRQAADVSRLMLFSLLYLTKSNVSVSDEDDDIQPVSNLQFIICEDFVTAACISSEPSCTLWHQVQTSVECTCKVELYLSVSGK